MENNLETDEMEARVNRATPETSEPARTALWLRLFRIAVVTAVIFSLAYLINSSVDKIRESDIWLQSIDFLRIALAVLAYIGAMLLSAVFWRCVMISFGHRPGWMKTLAAFFVSQFGRYVPGKAMVIVIRSDMIRDENLTAMRAAASVLIETLTWIFVGSMIASAAACWQLTGRPVLQVAAVSLAAITGFVTFPPIANWLGKKFIRNAVAGPFHGMSLKTLVIGWFLMTGHWCLNGLSLWLVVDSIPTAEPVASDYWLMLACVSIATVLGFVSLVPAGIGVRELAVIPMLTTQFGAPVAIFAAVIVRLVWLSAIVVGSGIIYGLNVLMLKSR